MPSMSSDSSTPPDFRMAETRWTQVIRSQGKSSEARMALKELTEAYYQPVYQFIRERSPNEEAAKDSTQTFFARVLDRYGFDGADPERGRFRSFLLGAVKHFLSEQRAHEKRQKRGGEVTHQSLESSPAPNASTAPGLQVADSSTPSPDAAFDRLWAYTLLERALGRLEAECQVEGKAKLFTVLQPWLAGGDPQSQAEAAMELGLSENATRMAIHRLRQRYRSGLRKELSHTMAPGFSVDEEMRHLFAALVE